MKVNVDFIPTLSTFIIDDPKIQSVISEINILLLRLNEIIRQLSTSVNTIEFVNSSGVVENVLCSKVDVSFGTAGTELTASHGLQKVPIAIIGTKFAGLGGNIGFSSAATSTNIYLKSDTDNLSGSIIII
jgi:hypothetical protein